MILSKIKLGLLIGIAGLCASCLNTKRAVYFSNQIDEAVVSNTIVPQSRISNNDILSINVSSLNPDATAVFNAPNATLSSVSGIVSSGTSIQTTGYLVKTDGNIQFPILGSVKADGLTTNELSEILTKTLVSRKLLIDPVVTVRFLNFRVTVLGEVSKPSVINVPNEKISLLEAVGLAGDITIFGKKENVMLIREEGGQKIIKRLDLTSGQIFLSPYYYLKSNDIIYVEPNKARIASSTRSTQFLPLLLSGLSLAFLIVDRLTR